MTLEEYFRKLVEDPSMPQSTKDDLQTMWSSHLKRGRDFHVRGMLREAIREYEREMDRPINAPIDAEIVESAFWQMGNAYRELGQVEKAITAYEKALELFRQYRVGTWPHESLAELYLEQGRIEEAIDLCNEELEKTDSWGAKQLLAKAMALKSRDSEQSSD
jgi:tetratricopeptide (TPR) repeat protein